MTQEHKRVLPRFENRRQVFLYLKKNGYQVSEAKLYRDFDNKKIRMETDGSVLDVQVSNYIQKHLNSTIEGLQDIKNKKEIEKLDEQIAKLRFEREKELGKHIPRKDVELELAARAMVLENGFRHLFTLRAHEWIGMVGGRPEKLPDFLRALNIALDEQLSSYATTKSFKVLIKKG